MGLRKAIGTACKLVAKAFLGLGLLVHFVFGRAGRDYGVGAFRKARLCWQILRSNRKIRPLSSYRQHLMMVDQILRVPKATPGDAVECGCFNGGSTVHLSIACGLTGRRLFVCDSFEGIPEPKAEEETTLRNRSSFYRWIRGEYAAEEGLEGVRKTVAELGDIDACVFVKGYFETTLPTLDTDAVVFVFEDADLPSSVEQCLIHLWPKMQDGARYYCHEPWSVEVVSLFYDKALWEERIGEPPPGFFGAATGGIVAEMIYANIGYAEKWDSRSIREHGERVVHAGSR